MTLHDAQAKAAALTAAGTPTFVKKNAQRGGGYQTRTSASARAAWTRYEKTTRDTGMLDAAGDPILAGDLKAADRCFLCLEPARPGDPLVPDHSHQSGFFRGWIHDTENKAEGLLRRAGILTDEPASFYRLLFWVHALLALVLMPDLMKGDA